MNEFAHLFFGKLFVAVLCAFVQKQGKKPAKVLHAVFSGKRLVQLVKAAEFVLHFVDNVQTEKKVSFLVKCDRETSVFNCAHKTISGKPFPAPRCTPFLFSLRPCIVRFSHRSKPSRRDAFGRRGDVFRLPQAVRTLDELPDDLRRSKFDTVAFRLVVFGRDRELHLVKPNVLVCSARFLCAEADCKIRRFVCVRTINHHIVVLLLSKQGGKVSRKKIIYVQRQFSRNKFLYNLVGSVVRVKDRFGNLHGKLRRNRLRHFYRCAVFLHAAVADRDRRAVKVAQSDCSHIRYTSIYLNSTGT
nr:MAG TPA: hypothetical protein [Caudoviricetes sp.]